MWLLQNKTLQYTKKKGFQGKDFSFIKTSMVRRLVNRIVLQVKIQADRNKSNHCSKRKRKHSTFKKTCSKNETVRVFSYFCFQFVYVYFNILILKAFSRTWNLYNLCWQIHYITNRNLTQIIWSFKPLIWVKLKA